ncbi:MAG TPA: RES family NAD+ phosphorylase [Vicinamibacteria bacterium]|nr:RES family NAD+ phosphorylase [Vicinamibacteria bacterium]
MHRGTTLWRMVRKGRNPWWFSSDGQGRFDLPFPEGTCYAALDEIAALLEVIGPDIEGGAVSENFLSGRGLRRLALPDSRRVADLADRRARGFGVTAEIHTVVPYDLPHQWSLALRRAGAAGVRYHVRHDPSFRGSGVGLFGKAGERKSWNRGREIPIGEELQAKLARDCQIRILALPRAAGLRILD